jgi:hypothetical protein
MPLVNVFPFGVCSITQKPCIPITPLPWQPGGIDIHTGSPFLVLPKNSLLGCMVGGFIEVTDAAQSTVFVDAPLITKAEAWKNNVALFEKQEARAKHAEEVERFLAETDAAIEADDPGGTGRQLLTTAGKTLKEVIGDDPVEIGLNFLPWKKVAQLRHLKKLPGALKDTWKAIRGGRGAGAERRAAEGLVKSVPKTVGKGLKNVRQIRTGPLRGYSRGNTELPGGNKAAKKVFRQQTGRNPVGDFENVVHGDKRIVYRASSESGPPKVEITDHSARFHEKISFTE